MKNKRISVIIPCFNEAKTIHQNIKKIRDYLGDNFLDFEIIAVNDGSQDETLAVLEKLGTEVSIKLVNNPINRGKGGAVKEGVKNSQFEIVMFLDADLAIPIESLGEFIEEINKGHHLVIASRFIPGMRLLEPVLWYRRIMEKAFRLLRMLIINNYAIRDTQCGFKVFTREVAEEIFPKMTIERFAFDAEMLFLAGKNKYKIKELPVSLQNPKRSSVRIFRDSVNMFLDLIRIRKNNLKGRYK